jgi:hypothetical protein
LFWRLIGAHRKRAVRAGDWILIFDGPRGLLFFVRTYLSVRRDLFGEHSEIARRLAPLVAAWEQDVDREAKRAP